MHAMNDAVWKRFQEISNDMSDEVSEPETDHGSSNKTELMNVEEPSSKSDEQGRHSPEVPAVYAPEPTQMTPVTTEIPDVYEPENAWFYGLGGVAAQAGGTISEKYSLQSSKPVN